MTSASRSGTLQLTLVRHARAEPRGPDAEDARRAVTPEGRARFERGVRGLAALDLRQDLILTSPLRRALDTSELLIELCDGPSRVASELAAPPGAELLARIEREHENGANRIALVGHEPWLGQLAVWLATGWLEWTEREAAFALEKGGVLVLSGHARPGRMTMRGAYPPDVLRRLGR